MAPYASRAKYGCLTVAGVGAVVLLVLGVAVAVAVRQNRATAIEHQALVEEIPDNTVVAEPVPVRLRLEVHTAAVAIRPIAAGESIRIDADYDPRRFSLQRDSLDEGDAVVLTVKLLPLGSRLMALLRAKLGGRMAMLRIALPRDVPLEIEGRLDRSFAAMELGGLLLVSTRLNVKEGGVKLSFIEPLARPMETLSVAGDRGSLSVVGLGNANPREARLLQHIGAVDLDLRGAWSRDAEVRVIGGVAGGSLWLPDNVRIEGLEDRRGIAPAEDPELPLPTLHLTVSENVGRFVLMD